MKSLNLIIILLVALAACNKKEALPLHFDVAVGKTAYKVGDTVRFNINGNPEQLTFYSGETGREYKYKDRYEASGTVALNFTYFAQYGTQLNTLQLLASQDFNGQFNQAGVAAANWTDITSKITPAFVYNVDNSPSGTISLNNFDQTKPLYLAFKFNGTTGATQRTWTIKNFSVKKALEGGTTLNLADISTAGWSSVNINNSPRSWAFTTAQIQFQGGAANIGNNEGWAVTKAIFLNKVPADMGVALKNMSTRLDSYEYIYTKPGTYTVTFVASNQNIYGNNSAVKEVTVVVD